MPPPPTPKKLCVTIAPGGNRGLVFLLAIGLTHFSVLCAQILVSRGEVEVIPCTCQPGSPRLSRLLPLLTRDWAESSSQQLTWGNASELPSWRIVNPAHLLHHCLTTFATAGVWLGVACWLMNADYFHPYTFSLRKTLPWSLSAVGFIYLSLSFFFFNKNPFGK